MKFISVKTNENYINDYYLLSVSSILKLEHVQDGNSHDYKIIVRDYEVASAGYYVYYLDKEEYDRVYDILESL